MNNVIVRSISGIIYVALIVGAIFAGWPYFLALTALFALLGSLELSHLFTHQDGISPVITVIDALSTLMITLAPIIMAPDPFLWSWFFILAIPCCFMARLIVTIFDLRDNPFRQMARSIFGTCYVGLPLAMLNIMYLMDYQSYMIVLCMFILIWLNDTGAFCFGVTLGKHRLCERLSPKKSWEGFWGGMLCCVLFGVGAYFWIGNFSMIAWIIYGIITCVFATWGDLIESLIKRQLNVKDSGHLIPGHGGILDRIDSLLLVAPMSMMFMLAMLYF